LRGATSVALAVSLLLGGCGREPEPVPPTSTNPPSAAATEAPSQSQSAIASAAALEITYESEPDPPETGDNALEVTVKAADGAPVTDAVVTAVFSMPAMPSMNMPAMRSSAALMHVGEGKYRGTGQLSMSGTWNVVVTVSRGAEQLGQQRFSVIAK
jgi:nitrogen fixation protein FixH